MTPEERRVKLAELLGYTHRKPKGFPNGMWFRPGEKHRLLERMVTLPDFCRDLNAVHEVEKTLTEEQCEAHDENLRQVCAPYGLDPKHPCEGYWFHATADQRTTALILTLSQAWT